VIQGVGETIPSSHSTAIPQIQSRIRAEYYGFVRRIPPQPICEILFQVFFEGPNWLNSPLDETIFREQLQSWRDVAYDILVENGPESLPDELRYFPALIFQVFAVSLQFLPATPDPRLDVLKFAPSQTFAQLSKEYTDCGAALAGLLVKTKPTLVAVQQSFIRDLWLTNNGELIKAWNHSGQTVKYIITLPFIVLYISLTIDDKTGNGDESTS
jgi:hypothetical protein